MHVRPANPSDFDAITDFLTETGLPHHDLTPSDLEPFLICQTRDESWFDRVAVLRTVAILPKHRLPDENNEICGVVGLKRHGRIGLIQALTLSSEDKEEGDRARLLSEIERRAREWGMERIYLLTGTGPGFFQTQGYQLVSYWELPEGLRSNNEAHRLRPPSEIPMRKRINTYAWETVPA